MQRKYFQDDTKATFSTGARKKERQKTDSNDESMEKLKELEELADQTFQKIFEEYMKNKDKPPVHQPTEDELELAQKNYFGEDEGENVCESFNQPFNAMWGLGRAQVPYHRSKFSQHFAIYFDSFSAYFLSNRKIFLYLIIK